MKRIALSILPTLFIFSFFATPVSAHRSGCHSWHSCPSDSGSYVCGDTGHCSACGNNQYCQNGNYSPASARTEAAPVPVPVTIPAPTPVTPPAPFSVPTPTPIVLPTPSTPVITPTPAPIIKPIKKVPVYFIGIPKTYPQLFSCKIVGNGASKIYHLQGSQWIQAMSLNNKTCFSTEAAARAKGYRKSKT